MTTYTIDTNAGPILTREFRTLDDAKAFAERGCPMTRRRGYSTNWVIVHKWHVCQVINTKGKIVHRLAVKEGGLR